MIRQGPGSRLPRIRNALLLAGVVMTATIPSKAHEAMAVRVEGSGISMQRLNGEFEQILREKQIHIARLSNPATAKALKREALDRLVRVELFWLAAQGQGLVVSDADVEVAVAEMQQRFRTPQAWAFWLERQGFTPQSYAVQVRKLLSGERHAQRLAEQEVQVTEDDIEAFHGLNARLFRRPEQVVLRHLRLAPPPALGAQERETLRQRLQRLRERILEGEPFDSIARRYSDDATRAWGGEMDPIDPKELPEALRRAVETLAPGALSEVLESDEGMHLLRLEERHAAESVGIEAARPRIRAWLFEQRGREALDVETQRLRERYRVVVLTPL